MDSGTALERGRAAFERRHWKEAYAGLLAADAEQPLAPEDLERLATAAHLIGRETTVATALTRAHHGHLESGDLVGAVRCASRIAVPLILSGDRAQSTGWIARATRLLDQHGRACPELGYLLFARALSAAVAGDPRAARDLFLDAVRVGEQFDDRSLIALARHGYGRALIGLGDLAQGAALLDEVMVAVTSGEVTPMMIGDVYCSVIEACHEMVDMRRAQEWTSALQAWSAEQPEMVPYRGQCLVHRAELLTLSGAWPSAAEEAERAREILSEPPHRAIGAALYQIGELHRLRGEFAAAEDAYRQASRLGRDPQPGFALLRLACGQVDAARAAIARAMTDPGLRRRRSWILPASIEIALAARDVTGARAAADELARIAHQGASTYLRARSAHGTGAVLLAEGDVNGALAALRRAASLWSELEAPYDAARTRVLIGLACRALHDEESAVLELEGARAELQALGAAHDAEVVRTFLATP